MNGLRNTLEKIQNIVKNVPNVQDVFIGDIYDNLNANESVCYPAGVVYQNGNRIDFTNHRIYTTVNIFLCDRETDDKSNKLSVQTWATNALYFIAKELQKARFYIPQETVQVKTFEERFGAVAAGAYLTCEVFTPMSECETLEWGTPEAPPEGSIKGLQFMAVIDDMDIKLNQFGDFTPAYTPQLEYTYDGRYWFDWDFVNGELIHVKVNKSVWVRAKVPYTTAFSSWSVGVKGRTFEFYGNGLIACYGYLDYLHGENFENIVYGGDYAQLFYKNTKLIKAPDIKSTSYQTYYQFQDCFNGCTSLIIGPKELHTDKVKSYMWHRMFMDCTSLQKTPTLKIDNTEQDMSSPGSSFAQMMFKNCTSLKDIDWQIEFKDNDIKPNVVGYFYQMFYNCISLKECNFSLDFKYWDNDIFRMMFYGCTALEKAPKISPAAIRTDGTTNNNQMSQMFQNCTSLVTPPDILKVSNADTSSNLFTSMFEGCTSLVDASFTIDTNKLYNLACQRMFYGCSKLEKAPTITATELGTQTCESMFYNCNVLTDVQDVLPATTIGQYAYRYMFQNCKALTTAPEIMATTMTGQGNMYSMFYGCIALTDVQDVLPATTLTTNCYYQMFDGCNNLTKSPELPATTGVSGCYAYMFRNTKVNRIKCLLNPAASQTNWVSGISGTIRDGIFIKHPNATWPAAGASSVPVGWTIINDGDDEPNLAPPRMLMKSSRSNSRNILDEIDTEWLTFLTEHELEDEYVKYIEEREG